MTEQLPRHEDGRFRRRGCALLRAVSSRCARNTRFSSRKNAITPSCSRTIQRHRAVTNNGNGDTAGFYVTHVRSSFGTVRAVRRRYPARDHHLTVERVIDRRRFDEVGSVADWRLVEAVERHVHGAGFDTGLLEHSIPHAPATSKRAASIAFRFSG